MASVASLNTTLQSTFTKRTDPLAVGAEWKQKLRHAVDQGMAFDDRTAAGWCVHVQYADLMKDPLGTMGRIYDHFGETPSGLHERRIEAWLREKPQTAHGKHVYDPADFGWSWDGLAAEWSDYVERYGIPREK